MCFHCCQNSQKYYYSTVYSFPFLTEIFVSWLNYYLSGAKHDSTDVNRSECVHSMCLHVCRIIKVEVKVKHD